LFYQTSGGLLLCLFLTFNHFCIDKLKIHGKIDIYDDQLLHVLSTAALAIAFVIGGLL
jgi:hypothetical protein